MTEHDAAMLPLLKAVRAQVENQFVVIWKCSNSQVNNIQKFIYGLCVRVFVTGMKNWENIIQLWLKVFFLLFFNLIFYGNLMIRLKKCFFLQNPNAQ